MFGLGGKISDRIRSGDIPKDALKKGRVTGADETPSIWAIKRAKGRGLGKGATQARNGGS